MGDIGNPVFSYCISEQGSGIGRLFSDPDMRNVLGWEAQTDGDAYRCHHSSTNNSSPSVNADQVPTSAIRTLRGDRNLLEEFFNQLLHWKTC